MENGNRELEINSSGPIIRIQDVTKTYSADRSTLHALKNVSLDINKGDIYGIIGMSGA